MLLPLTIKITISAILVAWSAIRSRYFDTEADLCRAADGLGIFQHKRQGFAKYLCVELIDFVVVLAHFERQIRVLAHEGVQAFANHPLRDARHPGYVDVGFQLRLLIELEGALADIDGHVADPFEIRGDFEPGGDEAKVASGRLMQRQQA